MLKEKIEQIQIVEKKTRELGDNYEKNNLCEAKLKVELDNNILYQEENKILNQEIFGQKGQILLNNAKLTEFHNINSELGDLTKKKNHLLHRLNYYEQVEDNNDLADNFYRACLKRRFQRTFKRIVIEHKDLLKTRYFFECHKKERPTQVFHKMKDFFGIWRKTHIVNMRINILNGTRERLFKKKVMTSLKRLVDTKKISVKFNETKKRLYLKSIFIAQNENKRERIRLRTLELAKKDAARAKILEEKSKSQRTRG